MSNSNDPFVSITGEDLDKVSGGAARVASSGGSSDTNDQLMTMLTQIGESIKDLAKNNNSGGTDMTTMMMMMMMMGGMGGGGGGAVAAPPPQQPTYVEVSAKGGCGKKGW
ncbi:MAG TPA: hypothetical protein VL326_03650 [Kofleriaceae bacterium]|jgi:hypothetical protein|nr:hypothetical protein [Kofleriaceae bacterium]